MVSCPGCGKPLTGRQKACSGRCRAVLSRRRRLQVPAEDLKALWALLKGTLEQVTGIQRDAGAMLERLWEAKAELEKILGG